MSTEKLICANLHLVRKVASSFGSAGRDPDVIQCGRIGLWYAAEIWDGERDFQALAKVCIRNAMINHLKKVRRWETPVDVFDDVGAEDERDLVGAIKQTFPAGSRERDILISLLKGTKKRDLAERYGVSNKVITRIAADAWAELESKKA